ncbi:hypothetical protein HDU96_001241, partial [Phlyctochytrium bullatum]
MPSTPSKSPSSSNVSADDGKKLPGLPLDVWGVVLSFLPPRQLCRMRFLCRAIHDEIFLTSFFQSLRRSPGGALRIELKADGMKDESLKFSLRPTSFTKKDGGRFVFTTETDSWVPLELLSNMHRSGMPYFSFLLLFWMEVPQPSLAGRSSQLQTDSQLGGVPPLKLPRTPQGDELSSLLAHVAQQKWLDYHASAKVPLIRRHFVPVDTLPVGYYRVGGGGVVCTYVIEDREEETQDQAGNTVLIPRRYVKVLRVSANLRWLLSGLGGGLPPFALPTEDPCTSPISATRPSLLTVEQLSRHVYSDKLEELRQEIVGLGINSGISPSEVWFDPQDPRVLQLVEEAELMRRDPVQLARELGVLDILVSESKILSRSGPENLSELEIFVSKFRSDVNRLLTSAAPHVAIARRRRILEKGLLSRGFNPDVMWKHGFSRRWIASGNFDGPCPEGREVLERLVRTVIEMKKMQGVSGSAASVATSSHGGGLGTRRQSVGTHESGLG